jgi:hypothetical protein
MKALLRRHEGELAVAGASVWSKRRDGLSHFSRTAMEREGGREGRGRKRGREEGGRECKVLAGP